MDASTPQTETIREIPEDFAFVEKVNQFLQSHNWTMARMAKTCQISSAALSQFLSHQYPGDKDRIRDRITTIINRETEKSGLVKHQKAFIETSVSRRVFDIARASHLFCEIGVCYSAPGLGKTEAVKEYALRNSDTILIEADPGVTAKVLFNDLKTRLGGVTRPNLNETFKDCVDRLKDSERLLIIDEAEQLPYKALELVRRLYDKSGIGILLTGTPKLLGNLRGIRGEFAQLYSRVGMAAKLELLTDKDIQNIVTSSLPKCSSLWKLFAKECGGNTRRLFKLIKRSVHIAHVNNIDIDDDVVLKASSLLKVEAMY